jgi:ankyrin repeat protein
MFMKKSILIILLALGASIVYAAPQSLKDAVMGQNFNKTKELLDAGADPNEQWSNAPALYWAAWVGRPDVMKLLLEKGAKVDGVGLLGITPLYAIADDPKTPDDYVKENTETNAKVLKRVKEEKARASGWLRETDPSVFGTPEERAKILLDAGADPNYLIGNGTVKEWTPFLIAHKKGHLGLISVMLASKKVDTEFRFHQWSEGVVKFVNYVNAGSYDDKTVVQDWALIPKFNTPLLQAVEDNNLALVKILVEAGASTANGKKQESRKQKTQRELDGSKTITTTTTFEYVSPLDVALDKGFADIIQYLESVGAPKYQH